jgi:hypothetical protein
MPPLEVMGPVVASQCGWLLLCHDSEMLVRESPAGRNGDSGRQLRQTTTVLVFWLYMLQWRRGGIGLPTALDFKLCDSFHIGPVLFGVFIFIFS